jgi:hypothetical protein
VHGTFSTTTALRPIHQATCVLRAVNHSDNSHYDPGTSTTFQGPELFINTSQTYRISSSAHLNGTPYDLQVTRSNIQVDGVDAYLPASVPSAGVKVAAHFPILTWNHTVDPTTGDVLGAITYAAPPDGARFTRATNSNGYYSNFLMHYTRTVPATGVTASGFAFSNGAGQDEVNAYAQQEQASFAGPTVAIGSPANNSTTTSSQITVSGTAGDSAGVSSVTVNGVAASVTGGTWSATVGLHPGANTVTALANNVFGNRAQASETVTYTPPVTTGPIGLPAFGGIALRALSVTMDPSGNITLVLGCPADTTRVKVTSADTAGRSATSAATITINAPKAKRTRGHRHH